MSINKEIINGFISTYSEILVSIEELISKNRTISALTLVYSLMDGFSHVANKNQEKGRNIFITWVDEWMLKKYPLPCTAKELYAARCGILHAQTAESDLFNKGEVRQIVYAIGDGTADKLNKLILNSCYHGKAITVKVEELFGSFRYGIGDCMNVIKDDSAWEKIFLEKAAKIFSFIPSNKL